MASAAASLSPLRHRAERRLLVVAAPIAIAVATAGGVAAAALAVDGRSITIAFVALLLLPVVLWRLPMAGVGVLVLAVTLIEQFPYDIGHGITNYTQQIPLFSGLSGSAGIAGLGVTPV